ncbi:hypothetical protein [Clostridium saccharoperbutylacetonicum]
MTDTVIDNLYEPIDGKKPRTYRKKVMKDFLNTSKSKRKTSKALKRAVH